MVYVRVRNGGITMIVPETEIDNYIRAGYERVKEKPEKANKETKTQDAEEKTVSEG